METHTRTKRVAITGMGIVTAIGSDVSSFWAALLAGQSGIRPVQRLRLPGSAIYIGAEVHTALPTALRADPAWRSNRGLQLALAALQQALAQARFTGEEVAAERLGLAIGTCTGGVYGGQRWLESCWRTGPEKADPQDALQFSFGFVTHALRYVIGARGPVVTFSTACSSGNNALGFARDLIRAGKADMVIAGGFDPLVESAYNGFLSVEALDAAPCRPYSSDRAGLSLGEGAGILVLERLDLAQRRGAPILAEVLGYGLAADAFHPTAPHPEGAGAARAMRAALADAGVDSAAVGYINGHGTGTRRNDQSETQAIRAVLGERALAVPVSSIKGATGHTLGAGGAVEGIATICAIRTGLIPPTVGLQTPDPQLSLDFVSGAARPAEVQVALSNSFAFGGNNCVLALGRAGSGAGAPARSHHPLVITGIGVTTPAGIGVEPFWQAMLQGEALGESVNTCYGARRLAHLRHVDLAAGFDPVAIRRLDRAGLLALTSAHEALQYAGLDLATIDRTRIGTVGSSVFAIVEPITELFHPVLEGIAQRVNPAIFPNAVYNATVGHVATSLQLLGPATTLTGGQESAALALAQAVELLRKGAADVLLCTGVEVIADVTLTALTSLGLVAPGVARPFDRHSTGMMPAEAAVTLVLESAEHARRRQARPLAHLVDYAITSEAVHPGSSALSGEGLVRAMREALREAPSLPDCIWAAASGLAAQDRAEAQALVDFAAMPSLPRVTAVKGVCGEAWGAGTLLSVAAAVLSMERDLLPGIANLCDPDPRVAAMLAHDPRPCSSRWSLVNSLTCSGTCASVLLGRA